MSHFLMSTLVGTILGIFAGLGTGGGSILILWLTVINNIEPYTARNINLLFFLPSAVITTVIRKKQDALPYRKILPAIIGGCFSAAVFSILGTKIELSQMRKLFGILLLFTGIRELLYKDNNQRLRKAR